MTMQSSSVPLLIAILLGIAYTVLALVSISHVNPEKKSLLSGRWPVFFFWWPIYSDMYLNSAKGLRIAGALMFPLIVTAYVWWWHLQQV